MYKINCLFHFKYLYFTYFKIINNFFTLFAFILKILTYPQNPSHFSLLSKKNLTFIDQSVNIQEWFSLKR